MRNINWDKPLSEDDETWLAQRLTPELQDKIDANRAQFNRKGEEVPEGFTGGDKTDATKTDLPPDDYDQWKVAELKAEAEGREPKIDLTGITVKADLIAALRTWDAAHPDLIKE
jgi:hypothetical protein